MVGKNHTVFNFIKLQATVYTHSLQLWAVSGFIFWGYCVPSSFSLRHILTTFCLTGFLFPDLSHSLQCYQLCNGAPRPCVGISDLVKAWSHSHFYPHEASGSHGLLEWNCAVCRHMWLLSTGNVALPEESKIVKCLINII